MEIVGILVLVLLSIPAGLLYALYRISRLERSVAALRHEVERSRHEAARGSNPEPAARPTATPRATKGPAAPTPTASAPTSRTPTPPSPAHKRTTATSGSATDTPSASRRTAEPTARDEVPEPPSDQRTTDSLGSGAEEARAGNGAAGPTRGSTARDPGGMDGRTMGGAAKGEGERAAARERLDLEALIGTTWLLRIGLGILAIALALFARLVAPQLSPTAKVALAYAGAMAFVGAGKYFEARLDRFARPLMAGGLAFGFFVAFAAHFVPPMQAVSLPVSVAWMAASMLTVLVAAERWRSESTAVLAIVLGHVSAQVSAGAADLYSLVMIGFLALTALALLLRHRWIQLGLFGVAASYGAHFLWMVAEREAPTGDRGFWLSLAFLTSYYLIFLVADVLWWWRGRGAEGRSEDSEAARVHRNARALGPVNLALYVSLATFVYVASGARVDSIEWFFLTLGAFQGALALLYREASHRDAVYYPVFGTVLWTLGLFAWLDALVLNLVLASQALLLLLAARRTGLRVFYGLSQAMMGVAFIHYVAYPAPDASTLGLFLGGLGVASVYLAKAWLEEAWYPVPPLAPLHAVLGGAVLLRESLLHLSATAALGPVLALAPLAVAAVALWQRRSALLYAVVTLALGLPVGLASLGPDAAWMPASGLAATALVLVWLGPRLEWGGREAALTRHGRVVSLVLLVGSFMAVDGVGASLGPYLLWMAIAAALIASQVGVDERSRPERIDGLAIVHYLAVSVLVIALTSQALTDRLGEPVWIAVWASSAFVAFALLRREGLLVTSLAILFGGYAILLQGSLFAVPGLDGVRHPALGVVWAGLVLATVPLGIAWGMDRFAPRSSTSAMPASSGTRESPEDDAGATPLLVVTLAGYALGLLVVGTVAGEMGGLGWMYVAPAVTAVALVTLAGVTPAPTAPVAAVLASAFWLVHFLTIGARTPGVGAALAPLLLFVLATLTAERLVARRARGREAEVLGPLLVGIVVLATLSGMASIHFSDLVARAWTTAGWSMLAGSLMTAAFLLRSITHRRVALALLGLCVVRVFAVDTVGFSDTARIGAFLVLGLILVGIALLYNRYEEELRSWL